MNFKKTLIKFHWLLSSQLGIDLRAFYRSMLGLHSYVRDWLIFRKGYEGKMTFKPCLQDKFEEAGTTNSEYFWQDLLVARAIFFANPRKHVDIGSRIDGFVAHIASFRECEVIDVRSISSTIPGILFRQFDLMNISEIPDSLLEYCDSLSCLHALEHFGLGRYGDPINPKGYMLGIVNMSKLLCNEGKLYLSTPIGQEQVEFNANWVFDPSIIINCAHEVGMELVKLTIITPSLGPQITLFDSQSLIELANSNYQLGLFEFVKNKKK